MRFEWDLEKAEANLKKHGISFEQARAAFYDPSHVVINDRVIDGEFRFHVIGFSGLFRLVLVAHTVRNREGEEVIRIISARKVTAKERKYYDNYRNF